MPLWGHVTSRPPLEKTLSDLEADAGMAKTALASKGQFKHDSLAFDLLEIAVILSIVWVLLINININTNSFKTALSISISIPIV